MAKYSKVCILRIYSLFPPCQCLRFGIKGAAYLKNKDSLVISCGPEGSSEWKPGSLQRSQNKIISTTAGGQSVTFHLFDHVTVSLCIQCCFQCKGKKAMMQ